MNQRDQLQSLQQSDLRNCGWWTTEVLLRTNYFCDYLHSYHICLCKYALQLHCSAITLLTLGMIFVKDSKPLKCNTLRIHKQISLPMAPDMFYLCLKWRAALKKLFKVPAHAPTPGSVKWKSPCWQRGSSPPQEAGATGLFTSLEKSCTCLWLFFSFSLKFPNLSMTLFPEVWAGLPAICCF